MASIALGAVGTIIGGPILGAIGAGIGSVIDQQLIFPAIFGQPKLDTTGPKLNDLRIQSGSEGSPVNLCIGPMTRVSGTVLWISDLIEEATQQDGGGGGGGGGGKGGGSPQVGGTTYTYFLNVAIGICEGPVSNVTRIWANGKLIYSLATNPTNVTSTAFSCNFIPYGYPIATITSPPSGPDLTAFKSGIDVTMSGWAISHNNGTFLVHSTEKLANNSTRLNYINGNVIFEAPGQNVTLFQNIPFNAPIVDGIAIYKGTEIQGADPTIQAAEGIANTPAYRGLCYVVFKKLALADYGNSLPQFNFLVEAEETQTYGGAIAKIMNRAGRSTSEYNVEDATTDILGYTVAGPQVTTRILEPLLIAGDLVVKEQNGKLVFQRFDTTEQPEVRFESDIAAHEAGNETPEGMRITEAQGLDLPDQVNVEFTSKARSWQRGSESDRLINFVTKSSQQINLTGITMTASEAKSIATRILWRAWSKRHRGELFLPPSFIGLEETDRLTVPYRNEKWVLYIDSVSRGLDFIHHVEGDLISIDDINSDSPSGGSDDPDEDGIYIPPLVVLMVLDFAPLRDEDVMTPTLYAAVAAADYSAEWRGSGLFSSDDDADFLPLDSATLESVLGTALTTLGAATPQMWDLKNSLDILVYNGSLQAATELEVLNGKNRIVVGKELIAFQDVSVVDTNTYRISKLLRGLRDTMDRIETHGAGETCLLLGFGTIRVEPYNAAQSGDTKFLRAVATGGSIDDALTSTVVLNAQSIRPFSPTELKGRRGLAFPGTSSDILPDSLDLAVAWTRRSRSLSNIFGPAPTPIPEGVEEYEVEILSADGLTVHRIVEVDGLTQIIYTKLEQIEDFGSAQSSIRTRVYQISPDIGRGKPIEAVL